MHRDGLQINMAPSQWICGDAMGFTAGESCVRTELRLTAQAG